MRLRAVLAPALATLLAACAAQSPAPVAPPAVAPVALPAASVPVDGALPVAQSAVVLANLRDDLVRRLRPEASAGAVGVLQPPGGAPRVVLDVARAFEVDSAQMQPETLLRLAECALAVQSAGAFVVHVVGRGEPAPDAALESLAERRANSVAAYLVGRGLMGSRVRAEGRAASARPAALELVFEPVIAGREVRAWMPPQP